MRQSSPGHLKVELAYINGPCLQQNKIMSVYVNIQGDFSEWITE
jgi:hypothetical protein